ncbi:MFS transporter [Bifidobacterium reuteri]|uniref:Transporter n=2 Tax=Bifidobacterium reuteri TaxID=983706 RepID=A0A087CYU2_9BIFI|nr:MULTISPECIES: MFS transporter [Bifidobacterium]KAA8826779.1 MFS transporter [Bifidobacterium reuteri]KFI88442.1 transporter [Bifidobacterium reuteri DSM 23975]TPF78979.1 MFS transporter [Bifidobacterium sp. UTCIF-1]TPF80441.1 MFS transporter [Bifidobacterium sp. UTCIF-24]TPF82880.1 MFS transporter [Bifidobacterium sp. UTCIF-3]
MSATATAAVQEPVKKDSVPEIIAASMVGTAIEFYDNYCYSIAAASYFGMIFFTSVAKSNPALATLMAFVTFAVSFLARPFGSMLFGHFGDKMGRKKTLVIALMTMGIATFLVGCLPGYDQIGPWSVVILCICRACQGVGLAGEWSGAALVATENAPADKRALYGSFPNLGAPIGFFCAYGLNLLLESNLSQEQMIAFGWRIPFLCSAVLVIIGLYVRARMSETPVFRKAHTEKRTSKHPLRDLLPYWKEVLLGTVAMGITYTLFYVLGTWSLSYGVKGLKFSQSDYLLMQMCSVVFFAIFIVVSCVYADKVGRKKVLFVVTAGTLVFSFFTPLLLVHSAAHIMIFLCVGFVLMGGLFGPCGAYLPELFPVHVRYSGAGLSYNLAAIFGGAFAPTIAQALVSSKFGVAGVGWYMAIMAALALLALFLIKESKDKDYEL